MVCLKNNIMSKKIYQRKDHFSNKSAIRITVGGKSKTIEFENKRKNGVLIFETEDKATQDAVEELDKFKNGTIVCIEGKTTKQALASKITKEPEDKDTIEYEEVTSLQQAKEILRGEPYNIPFQSLNSPENIQKKAEELGISFPSLVVPE